MYLAINFGHLEGVPQRYPSGTKTITMDINHLRPLWDDPRSKGFQTPIITFGMTGGWFGCLEIKVWLAKTTGVYGEADRVGT